MNQKFPGEISDTEISNHSHNSVNIIVDRDTKNVHEFMGDTLDGIKWNNHKRPFEISFVDILRTIGITGRTKLLIKDRFVNLYKNFKFKRDKTNFIYHTSKIIVTVLGIIVPALITIDNEISEKTKASLYLGYSIFAMSLSSTIINSLIDLFQVNKKSYMYTMTTANLEMEGWFFLTLNGKYKHNIDHSECWKKFLYRTEKINSQVFELSHDFYDVDENIKIDLGGLSESVNNNTNSDADVIYVNN